MARAWSMHECKILRRVNARLYVLLDVYFGRWTGSSGNLQGQGQEQVSKRLICLEDRTSRNGTGAGSATRIRGRVPEKI